MPCWYHETGQSIWRWQRIHHYVDGVETTKIKNGGMTRLLLTPGRHTLAFGGMGLKVSGSITLDLTPENDVNVMCYAKGSGIESVLTDVDVCALANSNQSIQKQSGGNGCLIAFIIVFLLFALGIISIKFTVFFCAGRIGIDFFHYKPVTFLDTGVELWYIEMENSMI